MTNNWHPKVRSSPFDSYTKPFCVAIESNDRETPGPADLELFDHRHGSGLRLAADRPRSMVCSIPIHRLRAERVRGKYPKMDRIADQESLASPLRGHLAYQVMSFCVAGHPSNSAGSQGQLRRRTTRRSDRWRRMRVRLTPQTVHHALPEESRRRTVRWHHAAQREGCCQSKGHAECEFASDRSDLVTTHGHGLRPWIACLFSENRFPDVYVAHRVPPVSRRDNPVVGRPILRSVDVIRDAAPHSLCTRSGGSTRYVIDYTG